MVLILRWFIFHYLIIKKLLMQAYKTLVIFSYELQKFLLHFSHCFFHKYKCLIKSALRDSHRNLLLQWYKANSPFCYLGNKQKCYFCYRSSLSDHLMRTSALWKRPKLLKEYGSRRCGVFPGLEEIRKKSNCTWKGEELGCVFYSKLFLEKIKMI